MNESSTRKGPQALDFKSATLYTVRLVLHSNDTAELLAALTQRMKDAGSFFENEAVVIDASLISAPVDWVALLSALNTHKLNAVGVVAEGELLQSALSSGLAEVDISNAPARPASPSVSEADVPTLASPAEVKAPDSELPSPEVVTKVAPAAMVVNRQLRSGQRIYARDTDLVIIGVVGQGAEVIADGNIHVYGPLRGKAMAGARGDTTARIFTTELDPELIAIAGVYRVIEETLDTDLHKKATVIQLEDDNLSIRPLS
ncbi:septum site-determining protein MinC [Paenalcaligenes niemegkensis]|uniref:septum site-determining protein MinC n=1 Tax=Paenalcaligenes niemegkensis TaxID=2895469 RepID=UPI001EE82378|nr:septum site-determining protein MinC [Paenalcaligenes niemegkensis]MCQ9617120.1 septum site-determining protein MinC [Paenalcaligenes niemegkensis]